MIWQAGYKWKETDSFCGGKLSPIHHPHKVSSYLPPSYSSYAVWICHTFRNIYTDSLEVDDNLTKEHLHLLIVFTLKNTLQITQITPQS